MFDSVKTGRDLIKQSFLVFRKYPKFIIPLIICWCFIALIILYAKFIFPWGDYRWYAQLSFAFLVIFALSTIIGFSCLVLLQLIKQVETGREPNLGLAFSCAFYDDLIQAMPILLIWAVCWFILSVIQVLFTRKRDNENEKFTAENAAKVIAGMDYKWTLGNAFIESIKNGIRMIVFLILPAIAWEDKDPMDAIHSGFRVLRGQLKIFASGFVLTGMASATVFLPVALLLYISEKGKITLPDEVWFGVILYSMLAWSFTFFIEQMYAAELYLWHMNWKKECDKAYKHNKPIPAFEEIKQPSIIDDVPDLIQTKVIKKSVAA